jgi:aconitase A
MNESINTEFEAYVKAELGDIAVVSEGRYISPKIQNYYKVWQHQEARLSAAKSQWQSIDTAPRDVSFLAITSCGGESYISTMRLSVAHEKNARTYSKEFHIERVTHWMALPDKP